MGPEREEVQEKWKGVMDSGLGGVRLELVKQDEMNSKAELVERAVEKTECFWKEGETRETGGNELR